ncbi:NACHT domain-containing NTPase [Rhodococcus sp. BUPNP1]|uniref:NACHT domain-containing protein n=1 Tax=Rhodococcus sp. BUPNP1 TaxID=1432786 RepID=UPI00117B3E09|nr:hypothetical protein [Rhodococcus sp. BUPNP1]
MAKVSASAAEFVFGFVMAHFGDQLDTCFTDRRRPAKDLPLIDGRRVPSPRLLSVFVVAARQEASLETALERTKGPDAEWLRDLQKASEELTYCMFYGREFTRSLLTELANGLGADAAQREALLKQCSGRGSDGTPDADMIEMVLHQQQTEAQIRDSTEVAATATQRALVDPQCLDFCVRSAARLSQLPPYYPRHLTVGALAERLTASVLDDGWEKGYAQETGLYSGLSRHSDTPATELVLQHRRSVLLGDPGHGKSTVLSACCLGNIAEGRLALFARLDDLGDLAAAHSSRQALDPEHAAALIVDAASAFSGVVCPSDIRGRLVESIVRDDMFLVALDGLDEIVEQSSRAAAEAVLVALADIPGTITIASRITGYTKPMYEAPELLVNHMDHPEVEKFVDSWFTEPEADLRDQTLVAVQDSDLSSLAQIPLLAGFICYVSTHETAQSTKHGLYQQYLGLFFERRWKPPAQRRLSAKENQRILELATAVAWAMANRPAAAASDLPLWADHISLRELAFDPNFRGDAAELTETDGLLIPHGQLRRGDLLGQQYRWLHRTIHEHLVGQALASWIQRDFTEAKDFLRTATLRPAWSVALEHCAGLLGPANRRLIDLLFELHNTEETVGNRFFFQLSNIIERSATSYRREELARRAFTLHHYGVAEWLDPNLTKQLALEIDPRIEDAWLPSALGTEYVARHIKDIEELAEEDPHRWIGKLLSFLEVIDAKRALFVNIDAYIEGKTDYIFNGLLNALEPGDDEQILKRLSRVQSLVVIFDIIDILAVLEDDSARIKFDDMTSTWDARGAFIRFYRDRFAHRPGIGDTPSWRRAMDSFKISNRTDFDELASGAHGQHFAVMAGYACNESEVAFRRVDPWVRIGMLFRRIMEDPHYAIPYIENSWNASSACSAISEIRYKSDHVLSRGGEYCLDVDEILNFHAAAEWATQMGVEQALPDLLQIYMNISRNIDLVRIPISNTEWLSRKIARYSWPSFFAAYRSYCESRTGSLSKSVATAKLVEFYIFGIAEASDLTCDLERLYQYLQWAVNSKFDPVIIQPVRHLLNVTENAHDLISIAAHGSNEVTKKEVLMVLEHSLYNEDSLPRYRKYFIHPQENVDSQH